MTQYDGSVMMSGGSNLVDSPESCCLQCKAIEGCNIWAYCGDSEGCGAGLVSRITLAAAKPNDNETSTTSVGDEDRVYRVFRHRECWLKTAESIKVLESDTRWTSGNGFVPAAAAAR